jgi:GT2 family glycosyltransferase
MDFSYRAYLAGLRVRIQSDLLLIHASQGTYDARHAVYADRFMKKHGIASLPHNFKGYHQARVDNPE